MVTSPGCVCTTTSSQLAIGRRPEVAAARLFTLASLAIMVTNYSYLNRQHEHFDFVGHSWKGNSLVDSTPCVHIPHKCLQLSIILKRSDVAMKELQ